MRHLQEEGNMALDAETMDYLPSNEDVLNILLSNCLDFLANDCRYTGTTYDLMVNWVHYVGIYCELIPG